MESRDLAGVRSRLRDAGIAFNEVDEKLVVPAEEAMGIAIVFEPIPTG